MDESGFEETVYRPHAWSGKGDKTHGDRNGKRGKRTNLIAAKRGKELLAPYLYEGTTTADWFNHWLEHCLFKELRPQSTLILDNAPFHNKKSIREIAEKFNHKVLFLPRYSPDFNPIEQDFANIKKRRLFAPVGTPIDHIIQSYGLLLE